MGECFVYKLNDRMAFATMTSCIYFKFQNLVSNTINSECSSVHNVILLFF